MSTLSPSTGNPPVDVQTCIDAVQHGKVRTEDEKQLQRTLLSELEALDGIAELAAGTQKNLQQFFALQVQIATQDEAEHRRFLSTAPASDVHEKDPVLAAREAYCENVVEEMQREREAIWADLLAESQKRGRQEEQNIRKGSEAAEIKKLRQWASESNPDKKSTDAG